MKHPVPPSPQAWGGVRSRGNKNKFNVISQKRCFSIYNRRVNKIEDDSIKSLRKTFKSSLSRPYEDLYKGRGKPVYEPE
jgi:hypothetical protein